MIFCAKTCKRLRKSSNDMTYLRNMQVLSSQSILGAIEEDIDIVDGKNHSEVGYLRFWFWCGVLVMRNLWIGLAG